MSPRRQTTRSLSGLILLLLSAVAALPLHAQLITYTFSATGSGSLGASPFADSPFTITATADTSQIVNSSPGIYQVPDSLAIVSVSGLGTATFTISTINVVNQNLLDPAVGFSDPVQNLAILFVSNPAFATYDLSTSVGPLSGSPLFNPGAQFATSSGNFSLTSVGPVTFGATFVPEPSQYALAAGLSLLGFVSYRRLRGSRAGVVFATTGLGRLREAGGE